MPDTRLDVYIRPVNWPLYNAEITVKKFWRSIVDPGGRSAASQVVSAGQKRSRPHERCPGSTKQYRPAFLLSENGKLERVRVRYRGDNPLNWMFEKKSLRLKLRKSRLREGTRVFNYLSAQSGFQLDEHIAFEIARAVDQLTPKSRPVEMFINDNSRGVMVETERLDESFLRNRNIMPVNIRASNSTPTLCRTDRGLFENAAFGQSWRLQSIAKETRTDLEFVFDLIRKGEVDPAQFERLLERTPVSDWASFAAYQVLVQSLHNDSVHNMRLISDVWRGQILPVPYDVGLGLPDTPTLLPIQIDAASHDLLRVLHYSSRFLDAKARALGNAVKSGEAYQRAQAELRRLQAAFENSVQRDIHLVQLAYYSGVPRDKIRSDQYAKIIAIRIHQLELMQKRLETYLSRPLNQLAIATEHCDCCPARMAEVGARHAGDADSNNRVAGLP